MATLWDFFSDILSEAPGFSKGISAVLGAMAAGTLWVQEAPAQTGQIIAQANLPVAAQTELQTESPIEPPIEAPIEAQTETQTEPQSVMTEAAPQTIAQAKFELGVVRSQLLDLAQFPLLLPPDRGVLIGSNNRLSPTQLSQPSLFWMRDQVVDRYGSDRLIEQWQAYHVNKPHSHDIDYVDVIVNERIWGLLNYFERYAFILQFGTAAKTHGYHLRVFHTGDIANRDDTSRSASRSNRALRNANARVRLRGAHFCGFGSWPLTPEAAATLPCDVELHNLSERPVHSNFNF